MMDVSSQKRLAAKILKVGISRVRVKNTKEVAEAITRSDIKRLIEKGYIYVVQKKGTTRIHANIIRKQKKKGRRRGAGSKKGSISSKWTEKVRPLRRMLKELKEENKIDKKNYRKLYLMVKGGFFRNKGHLLYYLKEQGILKGKRMK